MPTTRSISRLWFFCGPTPAPGPNTARPPASWVRCLPRRNELVYGGASVGIMGELADAVQEGGRPRHGIIPQRTGAEGGGSPGDPRPDRGARPWHQRKSQMADMSDGFRGACRAGSGRSRVLELLTWGQLGFTPSRAACLNIAGYFDA